MLGFYIFKYFITIIPLFILVSVLGHFVEGFWSDAIINSQPPSDEVVMHSSRAAAQLALSPAKPYVDIAENLIRISIAVFFMYRYKAQYLNEKENLKEENV